MPYIGKSPSAGVRQRYQYTATAGQTTFSGTDLGNLTLTYTDNNFVDVFQNGVLLKGGGTDYTATSGTSVVLATGASVSDVIEIIVYDVFSVGNFFNRTDSDSRYVNVDGDTMTGALDLNGVELVLDVDGDTSITADTDDQIDIKIAGSDKLKIDGSSHLVTTTAGTSNLVLGVNAGNSIASGGNYNVALGDEAGTAITTGDRNIAVGFEALKTATTAQYNVAVGYQALENNTGNNNTAVGDQALEANTDGTNNTAVGDDAGVSITTGDYHVAIGAEALSTETAGSRHVAVGYRSLKDANNSGGGNYYNSALGYEAGKAVTTGGYNTILGGNAGTNIQSGSSNICVGYGANTAHDTYNGICIGININATDNDFSFGKPSNVVTNDFNADANWSRSSDERLKKNITDQKLGLDFINDLRTVKYNWKANGELDASDSQLAHLRIKDDDGNIINDMDTDVTMHNFIAQEVKTALDKAGVSDFGGWKEDQYGVQQLSREMFVIPLVKAVQELSTKVDALEARIKKLEDG